MRSFNYFVTTVWGAPLYLGLLPNSIFYVFRHCVGAIFEVKDPFHSVLTVWMGAERGHPNFCRKLNSLLLLLFKILQKQPIPLLKLQQILSEVAATPCWELIKAASKSEEIVITETCGFPFSLLVFLPLCAVGLDLWSIFSSFLPLCYFLRGRTDWTTFPFPSCACRNLLSKYLMQRVWRWSCGAPLSWQGKGRKLFSAFDPTESTSWIPDLCQIQARVESTSHCLCITVIFCYW